MAIPTVKFAHLTDIHLPIREKPTLKSLLNKRVMGYLSWSKNRIHRHKQNAAEILTADVANHACQAALISGDIVNIALPKEFNDAKSWLDKNFKTIPVIFTPGNHDTYIKLGWKETLGKFAPFMKGQRENDPKIRAPENYHDFPFRSSIDNTNDIAVICVNSAPPTGPGLAQGTIGDDQLKRLRNELYTAGERGDFRIVMLHHPVNNGVVPVRKELTDKDAFKEIINEVGAELILHGHAHFSHQGEMKTPGEPAIVIGGASASHPHGHGKYRPARYNIFELSKTDDHLWHVDLAIRELNPETQQVTTIETFQFERKTA